MDPQSAFTLFLQGAAIGFTASVSPGPLLAFLVNRSVSGGWRSGTPVAFAPLISDAPIIAGVLLLFNHLPAVFLRGIGLAGGVFIWYLAWGTWHQWRAGAGSDLTASQINGSSLWRAVGLNYLNPSPYLFWGLANGPILMAAWQVSVFHAGAFLLGFYGVFVSGMLCLAALFGQARRLGTSTARFLLLVSIGVLVLYGGLLIWQALT